MWPKSPPKKIIVRMPNWLGDAVMATPILADLRRHFPKAKITAMCQSNVAPLLREDPNIDELYSYKRPSGWIPHSEQHQEIIQELQRGEYDLGILLTNSFSSAWWFWLGNVHHRIGFSGNLRNLFLDKPVPIPKEIKTQHLVTTYKMLLSPLGISVSETAPKLYVSNEEHQAARVLLIKLGIDLKNHVIVGINPGAAYGSAKCWLPDRFHEVTKQLLERPNVYVVYFGDQSGAPLVNDICKDLPERVINLAGKTNIRELMALIQCCSLLLTNDSGPMHMASALGVPILALFGSTSDVKTGPYAKAHVLHKHVSCSPCYKRVCPIDFRCMKEITVDEVYKELVQMIQHIESHPHS